MKTKIMIKTFHQNYDLTDITHMMEAITLALLEINGSLEMISEKISNDS